MPLERMQQRRDTTARWADFNPVLLDGEIGIDGDLDRYKIGDGVTRWLALPFADRLEDSQAAVDSAAAQVALAQSAAASAAQSAADATEVTGIDTTDEALAYTAKRGPATIEALVNAYAEHKHPMKRAMRDYNTFDTPTVFRVMHTTTSIGTFDNSGIRVATQQMGLVYGDSAYTSQHLGVYGGDYEHTINGWKKQRYGGAAFTRLVGDAGAGPISLQTGYFDTIELDVSREADSGAIDVLVDGVVMGRTTGPGAQVYRQRVTITVPLGYHDVSVAGGPSSGRAYLEWITTADSARRNGLEFLSYGLGGTGLKHMTQLYDQARFQPGYTGPATENIPGIPIEGNNGRDYFFARDDIDLFVIEGPVNDGGDPDAMACLDYAVEQARIRDVPVLLIIEPMQGYAAQGPTGGNRRQREKMLALGRLPWVTVLDWHGMCWPGADLHDTTYETLFRTTYFPGGAGDPHPNSACHQVLTAPLCALLDLPLPDSNSDSVLQQRRLQTNTLPVVSRPRRDVTIFNRTYRLPPAEGTAHLQLSPFGPSFQQKTEPYYRVPLLTGARDLHLGSSGQWLLTPSGTDEFGSYVDGGFTDGGGYAENGTLMRVTARLRRRPGSPNATCVMVIPAGARMEDDKGTQIAPGAGSAPNKFTQCFYLIEHVDPPVILTWLIRVVDNTKNYMPTFGGSVRLYEATCLPVPNAASPPILSSAVTPTDHLRVLDPARDRVTGVTLGGGVTRRYTKPAGGAFELTSVTAAEDLYPEVAFAGEVVPYFRDTTVTQLGKAPDGGGGYSGGDYNAFIQANPSGTDTQGKYRSQNFEYTGWSGVTAGQEFTVLAKVRQIIALQAGDNAELLVNGQVRAGRAWLYYGTDDATAPVLWIACRIRAVANGDVSVRIRGWVYEVHVVNAPVPIKTT